MTARLTRLLVVLGFLLGADGVYARSYFGARYLRADLGRFTTVDPVYTWTENLVDPQRWNRYSYVRNNPLKYVDPTGRYQCKGNESGCAQVAEFVGGVRTAMEGIEKQEGRDSKGYKALAAIVAYYGDAGVDNGVVVTVGTISNPTGAEAQAVSRTRITVDVERVTGNSENIKWLNTSDVHGRVGLAYGAAVMAHEGSHALGGHPKPAINGHLKTGHIE